MKNYKTFEELIENKINSPKNRRKDDNRHQNFHTNTSINSQKQIMNSSNIKKKSPRSQEKESDYKLTQSVTFPTKLDDMKQEIMNCYQVEQEKQKLNNSKISIQKRRNNRSATLSKKSKKNTENNIYNSINNKYEKYNKENLAYELYHEYQKLNFNEISIPFLERMELYALKKNMREYKIQELLKMQNPKLPEKDIIDTFNRLIEDSNRRIFQSYKKKNNIIIKNKNNIKKPFNKKKWDEIYENRFGSKLREYNERLEKLRNEKKIKEQKEEEKILDDMKMKQDTINKKFYSRTKSCKNSKTFDEDALKELNQRLYYNEINKKDITYKAFVNQIQEIINNNNNNDIGKSMDFIKSLNCFNVSQKENKENKTKIKNNFRNSFKKAKINTNNKNISNSSKNFSYMGNVKKHNNTNINSSINNIDLFDKEYDFNDIHPENKRIEKIVSGFFEN